MKTIAIIHLGPIGDVINTSPVCLALKKKYPDAQLIYFCIPSSKAVAKCMPGVEDVIVFDRYGEHKGLKIFTGGLKVRKKYKIDLAVLLNENFRSALYAKIIGAKKIAGKDNEGRGFLIDHITPFPQEERELKVHASEQYMRVLKPLGLYNTDYEMDFKFSTDDELCINSILKEENPDGKNLIVFCPKSSRDFKDWAEDDAIKFSRHICNSEDKKLVIIGVQAANDFVQKLYQNGINNFIDMTNRTTIPQLGALISKASTVFSMDTSSMHLACALKIPVMVMFFQDNYEKWGPKDLEYNKLLVSSRDYLNAEKVIEEFDSFYDRHVKNA